MKRFYLGAHHPNWLERPDVPPLLVSRRWLYRRKRLPVTATAWGLDSGAFTELKDNGRYMFDAKTYAGNVRRFQAEIGPMDFASPMDWMCEPVMIAKTGLTVAEHQKRTVENLLELRVLAPDLPWIPVLQGFAYREYLACVEQYDKAGIDLRRERLVGLGSVCRRQGMRVVEDLCRELHGLGLRLHGFGLKTLGILRCHRWLSSADSMAWSRDGRYKVGCTSTHKTEANCFQFAMRWHDRLIRQIDQRRKRSEPAGLFA